MVAKRAARVTAIAALAAAAAACSLVDLSGLTDGAVPDDAAVEAGSPDVDAASVKDAGASDASDASDADASDAADAAPVGFCAGAGIHTLCDDFDTSADAGWSSFEAFGGGTGAADLGVFASPPASYAATAPTTSPDAGEAWMFPIRKVPITSTHVRLEAKVQACSAGNFVFLSINNNAAGNKYGAIDFGTRPIAGGFETFMLLKHDAYTKDYKLGAALPSTRFVKVVIETDIAKAATGTLKLTMDGVVVVNDTNLPTDQSSAVTKRSVFAGVYAFETSACTARIDDVLIDAN